MVDDVMSQTVGCTAMMTRCGSCRWTRSAELRRTSSSTFDHRLRFSYLYQRRCPRCPYPAWLRVASNYSRPHMLSLTIASNCPPALYLGSPTCTHIPAWMDGCHWNDEKQRSGDQTIDMPSAQQMIVSIASCLWCPDGRWLHFLT